MFMINTMFNYAAGGFNYFTAMRGAGKTNTEKQKIPS